jgi:hypothetical protein
MSPLRAQVFHQHAGMTAHHPRSPIRMRCRLLPPTAHIRSFRLPTYRPLSPLRSAFPPPRIRLSVPGRAPAPFFLLGALYQPGAARQKKPSHRPRPSKGSPEVAALAAARFDPLLSLCWSLHAIENTTPPSGSTEGGCDDYSGKQAGWQRWRGNRICAWCAFACRRHAMLILSSARLRR